MFKKIPVFVQFAMMVLLADLLFFSFAHAKEAPVMQMLKWQNSSSPIKITGITDDGKYPVYDIEGDVTDLSYKAGNFLYTSGDLVHMLVFLDPNDAKSKRYICEFLCKDKKGQAVGLNPSFKFLVHKELLK